ncbi:MAG: hypothetical protein V4708_00120 [Bacteroidota bacterium]
MKNIYRVHPKLIFHNIVISKESIKSRYPGGLWRFSRDFRGYQYNTTIIVLTSMGSEIDDWINTLESYCIEYQLNVEEPSILINIKK